MHSPNTQRASEGYAPYDTDGGVSFRPEDMPGYHPVTVENILQNPEAWHPDIVKLAEQAKSAVAEAKPLVEVVKEVRTVSSTGGEKGVKPQDFSLIPVGPLSTLAELYSVGAKKYDKHNWRNGYEWSKSYSALQRHANAFWSGEDNDSETGLPHMASVIFHAMALMEFAETHPLYDDRYRDGRSND